MHKSQSAGIRLSSSEYMPDSQQWSLNVTNLGEGEKNKNSTPLYLMVKPCKKEHGFS
jgi:hypothetical protein